MIRELPGVGSVYRVHLGDNIKLTVNYDSNVLKGTEIADIISERDPNY